MGFRFQPPSEEGDDLGPPPGPFQFRRAPRFRVPGGVLRWGTVIIFLIILYIIANIAKGMYADWLWFESVTNASGDDYSSVYSLRITTRIWLFFAGAGVFLAFFIANLAVALRTISTSRLSLLGEVDSASARRVALIAGIAITLFLAVIYGSQAASHWDTMLLYMNSVPFGVEDAQFGKDVGFYVFELPALNFILGWSLGVVVLTTIVVTGLYAFRMLAGGSSGPAPALARPHISLLLIIVIALFIWRYWLGRYALVYSDRGAVFGATYTDIHAQLPVTYVLMALAALTAVAIAVSPVRQGPGDQTHGAPILWVVVAIAGGLIYPATVQSFEVEPNEFVKEQEYIERNIEATRLAFGLDASRIEVLDPSDTPANDFVTEAEIEENQATIQNIRLWDHRPLLQTLDQRQTIRPRYDFLDVDVDRYIINGELRQVMLAPRELDPSNLPENNRSWVNTRLEFTHGFGLVMVPVNEVVEEGLPEYFVEGIPPSGVIDIEQPRVYFGEMPDHYVIVNTNREEFDYQGAGDEQVRNTYDGGGGIKLDSFLKKFVYAWEYADRNLLISDALNSESRLLVRRNIHDRVTEIAPFLRLDGDPYIVVADGQLVWMQDAYTYTDKYPDSTRSFGLNYIRNSVKIAINAYNGETTFYLIDEEDPIAAVYDKIYPDLFTPIEEMPLVLRAHMRYPMDLFEIQALMYTTYHITDANSFFNGEDLWAIPTEKFQNDEQTMEPYYVIMKLPGQTNEEEFAMILPFTPANKTVSIAWLAARADGQNYGKMLSFRFPTETGIFGPIQIESRIDTDTSISQQFSLWNQSGSEVIRGNLLMIPIGEGNLFVEPIYLRASGANTIPELKRVIVANGRSIAMEPTLGQALDVVFGRAEPSTPSTDDVPTPVPTGQPTPVEDFTPEPTSTPAPTSTQGPTVELPDDVGELIAEANASFERAQALLQAGDFAAYGEEIDHLEEVLQALADLTADQ